MFVILNAVHLVRHYVVMERVKEMSYGVCELDLRHGC